MALAHSPHLRAQVHRVQMHRDAVWLQHAHQLVRDLHPHALLDREPAREDPHEASQLGDADDLLVRDVADERVPVEGQGVVLAERVELDRPLDDLADVAVRTAVALRGERCEHLGIALVARGGLEERTQVARRCFARPGSVQVHAQGGGWDVVQQPQH